MNTVEKQLFVPHKQEKGQPFEDFLNELQEVSPSSGTLGERNPVQNLVYMQRKKQMPDIDIPDSFADRSKTKNEFLENIPTFDCDKVTLIEEKTRRQADNTIWANQRNGSHIIEIQGSSDKNRKCKIKEH